MNCTKSTLWVVAILSLGVCGMPAAEEQPFVLSIESDIAVMLQYEPLPLRLVLQNTSGKVVETTLGLNRLGVETTLLVAFEDGPYIEWKRGWLPNIEPSPLPKESLEPGQSITYSMEFFWQEVYPAFEKTGSYTVKAKWHGSLGAVESNAYEVKVVEGTEIDQMCLSALLIQGVQGYLSMESRDFMPKNPQKSLSILHGLYNIAEQLGECRYAVYALGTLLSMRNSEEVDAEFRSRIVNLAQEQLKRNPHPRISYFLQEAKPLKLDVRKTIQPEQNEEVATQILATVRDYFVGLATGDPVRLGSAVGLGPQVSLRLLDAYKQELQEKGVSTVQSVTVPEQSLEDLRLRELSKKEEVYSVVVRGVQLALVRLDGTQETQTFDKGFRLRRHEDGHWIIITPQ